MANRTDYYNISTKLREAVLNYLTGLVLKTYNEAEKAETFFAKTNEYLK